MLSIFKLIVANIVFYQFALGQVTRNWGFKILQNGSIA